MDAGGQNHDSIGQSVNRQEMVSGEKLASLLTVDAQGQQYILQFCP